MKYLFIISLAIIILLIGAVFIVQENNEGLVELKINDVKLQVEVADTAVKRTLGLSGRDFLAEDHGMFFIFEESGFHSFWMKDMKFAIDIIWVDPVRYKSNGAGTNYKIIDITKNVQPNSFPETFQSQRPVRYVLEVNAGWVGKYNINVGDFVDIPNY